MRISEAKRTAGEIALSQLKDRVARLESLWGHYTEYPNIVKPQEVQESMEEIIKKVQEIHDMFKWR